MFLCEYSSTYHYFITYSTLRRSQRCSVMERYKGKKIWLALGIVAMVSIVAVTSNPQPPTINDFQLKHLLGKGNCGWAFLALKNKTPLVIKIVKISTYGNHKKGVVALNNEAKIQKLLIKERYTPDIYYAFQSNGFLYTVMHYMPGGTVFDYLIDRVVWPRNPEEGDPRNYSSVERTEAGVIHHIHEREMVKNTLKREKGSWLVADMAFMLASLRKHGISHNDFKLSNVLIGADGRPCLTDFGVSTFFNIVAKTMPISRPTIDWEEMARIFDQVLEPHPSKVSLVNRILGIGDKDWKTELSKEAYMTGVDYEKVESRTYPPIFPTSEATIKDDGKNYIDELKIDTNPATAQQLAEFHEYSYVSPLLLSIQKMATK